MTKPRIYLLNFAESQETVRMLDRMGFQVESGVPSPSTFRDLRSNPPNAILIDTSRRPSAGRDVGIALRRYKDTRHVPFLFVGSTEATEKMILDTLPDARFSQWERLESDLLTILDAPVTNPYIPSSSMAGYSGTPLTKKLGIKDDSIVVLVHAPSGIEEELVPLPKGVVLRRRNQGNRDITLWFNRTKSALVRDLESMIPHAEGGGLWIIWPKKASGIQSDLTQQTVREIGLGAGLVDYKICSINAIWSGLRFSKRK